MFDGTSPPVAYFSSGVPPLTRRLLVYFCSAAYTICQFKIKPASGSLGDRYGVYFFAWGAGDDASPIYPAGVTGVDEPVSVTLETLSIREIGSLYVPASGILISPPFSVAQAFGNVLPPVWGVLAVNRCGLALDATDNTAFWRGVQFEVV